MRKFAVAACSLALALGSLTAVHAQPPFSTEGSGSYKEPAERAAVYYGRGVRAKRKAEKAQDPGERRKLYERAKEELSKAVGYDANFDATLALGQVYVALGNKVSAVNACSRSLALKPGNRAAQACIDAAQALEGVQVVTGDSGG